MREILRDEVDLDRTLRLEELSFPDELTEPERAVPAAHQRNRAERTAVVASLAHFEIAHVRQVAREEPYTRMYHRSVFDEAALVQLRN